MDKKETRKEKREKEYKDSVAIMEEVYSEELEENEQKRKEAPLEMNEECKEFIESVKQIKTLTLVERPWWYFYIPFWAELTILVLVFTISGWYKLHIDTSFTIIIYVMWLVWVFITTTFSFGIYRILKKPNIYQMYKSGGKDIYLIFINKMFIYWDGENTTRFYDKKTHRCGKATFKRDTGYGTLDGIISCNKMKKKERRKKIIYKGKNLIYSTDAKVITDKNNIIKKYTVVLGMADGTTSIPQRVIGVNDINRKIYVPKQIKSWMKRKGIELDIPNMVEIPDELIWKHIKVKDLYN